MPSFKNFFTLAIILTTVSFVKKKLPILADQQNAWNYQLPVFLGITPPTVSLRASHGKALPGTGR
jgi:hypothetical protein